MPRHAMTPHYSGTTLDAQIRYAAGTKEILRRWFDGEALNETDVIVQVTKLKVMPASIVSCCPACNVVHMCKLYAASSCSTCSVHSDLIAWERMAGRCFASRQYMPLQMFGIVLS